jgi:hypothetical protein
LLPRKAYLTEREKAQYEKRLETDTVFGAEYEKAFEEAAREVARRDNLEKWR